MCYQASSHVWALPADTTALLPQRSALVSERKGNIVTPLKDFETGRLEAPHTRRCQLENAIGESAPYDDVLAYTEGYTTSVGPQLRLKNLLSVPLEIILFLDVLLIKNAVAHEGESTVEYAIVFELNNVILDCFSLLYRTGQRLSTQGAFAVSQITLEAAAQVLLFVTPRRQVCYGRRPASCRLLLLLIVFLSRLTRLHSAHFLAVSSVSGWTTS